MPPQVLIISKTSGFSLIEILIGISLVAIIIASGSWTSLEQYSSYLLDADVASCITDLEELHREAVIENKIITSIFSKTDCGSASLYPENIVFGADGSVTPTEISFTRYNHVRTVTIYSDGTISS